MARPKPIVDSLVASTLPDELLFAFWLQSFSARTTLSLVAATATGQLQRYVCAFEPGSPRAAFRLGRTTTAAEPIAPRGLSQAFQATQPRSVDSVIVFTEAQITHQAPSVLLDSLRLLELAFGRRARRPVLIFAFSEQKSLERSFPIRWADGQYSDLSLTTASAAGIAFVAPRELGYSVHELVHLVVASALDSSRTDAPGTSYFSEEALARAMGGSKGVPFRELARRNDLRDAPRTLWNAVDEAITLDTVTFGGKAGPIPTLDLLGAIYNVALTHCTAFPLEILFRSNSLTVGRAVQFLSDRLHVTREAVVSLASVELSRRVSVLSEIARGVPLARRVCAAP